MITLPKKPKITKKGENRATFEIEACYPGYGITLGNAFRRILLSSLSGAAITDVKISGVQHEFSTIPHVVEDVIQIILNLKQIRFKLQTEGPVNVQLKVKGEKEVKAGDIQTVAGLEVVNKDAHIATLTNKKAELEMEIKVDSGLGYSPLESRKKEKIEIGKIAIDTIFSPVRRANYVIENMRVGEKTNYNRLIFDIETDGTITPAEAFLKAGQILVKQFKVFTLLEKKEKKKTVKAKIAAAKKTKIKPAKKKSASNMATEAAKQKIKDLKISPRVIASLEAAGFKTVAGLIRKSEGDLKKLEGLGGKGIIEIKRAIGKLGLTLKS
ncbi:MAG: DNA-directed RNA polymerase subunit alpha [Patescibacteria group bacterium]|nr:DNA-directed RNA polymerase subunit alpha [Patescibacteria group bacterium]